MRHDETLILGHEQRLSKAETRLESHGQIIQSLEVSMATVANSSSQMKNWVIGGVVTYAISQIGLVEFVKNLFK